MILLLDIPVVASFLVPGGQPDKVSHFLIGTTTTSQSSNAKRAFDGQIKGTRQLTDLSWEKIIRVLAEKAGEDELVTNEKLNSQRQDLDRVEKIADAERNVGSYPLGIIGFLAAEILPSHKEFGWLKPTLDHEVNLTVGFTNSKDRPERIKQLSRSDMAQSAMGQSLIESYSTANDADSEAIYTAGLCVLTWFQLLVSGIIGKNATVLELKVITESTRQSDNSKSSVDVWFHYLKSYIRDESWERIYENIANIRNMEFHWGEKNGIGKLRKIRQGVTPLLFEQVEDLIVTFSEDFKNDISTMNALERGYRIAVLMDNFEREWTKDEGRMKLLPLPDFSNALQIGYLAAQERYCGQ